MLPRCVFADVATDARFVLVLLRGALDGLAAVPAYGDGAYAAKRGALAITSPQLKLDGTFALHPSLTQLHERYQAKELLVFHAVASPYRERSHCEGRARRLAESGVAAVARSEASRDGPDRAGAGAERAAGVAWRCTRGILGAVAIAGNGFGHSATHRGPVFHG
jgi:uncharacterized protein (DUF1501 family)